MSQQVYSVYDAETGLFKYYTGPDTPNHRPPPGPNPNLGTPADEAGVKVPFGARFVGTGEQAVGRVAEAGINWQQVLRVGIYVLAAYGAWKLFRVWRPA